jgi:phosphoadenosine phosphosulfate reductase
VDTQEQTIFDRHEKIALQFSGGKDSLALLHLFKPHWDRITVYWLNSGDPFPETERQMREVAAMVPHFVEIEGRQPEVIATLGIPSDMVPALSTPIGRAACGGRAPAILDRYSCCLYSLFLPMHERMKADGITCIIRGQKHSDMQRSPLKSGDVEDGIEYLFPLEDFDDADVFAYLGLQQIELPSFYPELSASPDCMTCSAYWEEGRGKYLRKHHPGAYAIYQERLGIIKDATAQAIAHFNMETSE